MMYDVICKKCGNVCDVEQHEINEFVAWCDECNDYPEGWNCLDYAADWLGDAMDYAKENHVPTP